MEYLAKVMRRRMSYNSYKLYETTYCHFYEVQRVWNLCAFVFRQRGRLNRSRRHR